MVEVIKQQSMKVLELEYKKQLQIKDEKIEEVRFESNWLHIANKKNVNFHKLTIIAP